MSAGRRIVETWEERTRRVAAQPGACPSFTPTCVHGAELERVRAELARVTAERDRFRDRVESAERLAEDALVLAGETIAQRRRLELAKQLAPNSGRMRRAVLAALKRGKTWDLSEDDYYRLAESPCSYCGGSTGSSIGLDRIDNEVGYTLENVVPSCGSCNVTRQQRGVL